MDPSWENHQRIPQKLWFAHVKSIGSWHAFWTMKGAFNAFNIRRMGIYKSSDFQIEVPCVWWIYLGMDRTHLETEDIAHFCGWSWTKFKHNPEWLQRLCLFWISPTFKRKSMSQPLLTVKTWLNMLFINWLDRTTGKNSENKCFWSSQSSWDVNFHSTGETVIRWLFCEQLEFSTYHDYPRLSTFAKMGRLRGPTAWSRWQSWMRFAMRLWLNRSVKERCVTGHRWEWFTIWMG